MVEGARLWHEQGLNPPQCVIDATNKYISEQDKFQMFVEDYLDLSDKTAFTSTKSILSAQHHWAKEQNEWAMREKDLIDPLEAKGCRYGRERTNGSKNPQRGFHGVSLSAQGMDMYLADKTTEYASKSH
jgi:putative DNA primase/helicase